MFKQADGSYACVAESAMRFTLGEATTRWEDDVELEASSEWLSSSRSGKKTRKQTNCNAIADA